MAERVAIPYIERTDDFDGDMCAARNALGIDAE
jgi:hypothetical protein